MTVRADAGRSDCGRHPNTRPEPFTTAMARRSLMGGNFGAVTSIFRVR
jgi:hypothetical protein